MQRSFGTEISGNRGPGAELSDTERAAILSAVEAGEKKTEIAARYHVSRRVVYSTLDRWNNHHLYQTAQKASSTPEASTSLNCTQEFSNRLCSSQVPGCRGHRSA